MNNFLRFLDGLVVFLLCFILLLPYTTASKIGTLTIKVVQVERERPSSKVLQHVLKTSLKESHEKQRAIARANKCISRNLFFTMYYSVMPNQSSYAYGRTFEEDFNMNCQGDCLVTASGVYLGDKKPMTVAACDPAMPFGTKIKVEGMPEITCIDRGGAIGSGRVDLWLGIGEAGLSNVYNNGWIQGTKNACLKS